MTEQDKHLDNIAEHVIDLVEHRKSEGRAALAMGGFYVVFFIMIAMDRMLAAGIALFGAFVFYFLFNREQTKARLIKLHIRQLERENEPSFVTAARLVVDMHEQTFANAVSERCVEMRKERDEKA